MTALQDKTTTNASASGAQVLPDSVTRGSRRQLPPGNWNLRPERWDSLIAAERAGEDQVYDQLLRELDLWLRRYYARRLPAPAADDARQEALIAIHVHRHRYMPPRSFGAWVATVAYHKWIDRLREASRFKAVELNEHLSIGDHEDAAISSAVIDDLLGRLAPGQAHVIRLVKLQGMTVENASNLTGQSVSLVKVNIHRGLKKLSALARETSSGGRNIINRRLERDSRITPTPYRSMKSTR